jgi:small subunit ribosomal protein S16
MSTKIRLRRSGRKKKPFYRVIVIDSRDRRDGRCIEDLGWFNPLTDACSLKLERYDYWRGVGAIASERVEYIVKTHKSSSLAK